ncbi:hypothetical protein [Tianweitania sediminis]|uniref:Uncharacterized protein n=1 Tax=Tianweitania sediminis TaxID=1502156 RepID=A0A8J7RIN4_9HYPH|nr:hypothetical protein [Tianweitania sediminis]MBP0439121.1 hypothetical protein [Tianweitania sediminis]
MPGAPLIHPVQEIDAFTKAIQAGITSRKRVAAQDVEDIDDENEADQARTVAKDLGDTVYTPAAGAAPSAPAADPAPVPEPDEGDADALLQTAA